LPISPYILIGKTIQRRQEMKKILLLGAIVSLTMWNVEVTAQPSVYEYTVDTSLYDNNKTITGASSFFPGPELPVSHEFTAFSTGFFLTAYKKKNSDQYDIYSFSGKIGSITIPDSLWSNTRILFSQTFIDADQDWECLVKDIISLKSFNGFKVLDNDGTELLADTGNCYYGYDGQNTYVLDPRVNGCKAWRFRANVSSASPNGLTKTAAMPHAMMTFGPTGDYRIRLAPSSGGKTSVSLFDMLGRCVFSRDIGNLTSPVNFTIPENNVPPSPFITKVQNEKGAVLRKEIPVR
jgi:hypothetical protein